MINLLPESEKLKIKQKQQNIAVICISLSLFLVSFITWFIFKNINEVYSLQDQNNIKEIEELKIKIEDQQKVKKELNKIFNKSDALTNLKDSRIVWSEIISEFSKVVPQNVRINSFSALGNPLSFTISATTNTRQDVEDFKQRIDNSKVFANALYNSTTETTNPEGKTFVTFNMTFIFDIKEEEQ